MLDQLTVALAEWQPVSTSRPAPQAFAEAFASAGGQSVVCVTLSSELSGTNESARLAAGPDTVVIDSRSIGKSLGNAVLYGSHLAEAGADAATVAAAIESSVSRSSTYFYVDTLEYLRRGGRISGAKALLSQALTIKPILTMQDGNVVLLEKVRTSGKAIARLVELACEAVTDLGGRALVDVQHLGSPERAEVVADGVAAASPHAAVSISTLTAVIGAHVGPGTVAVSISPDFAN